MIMDFDKDAESVVLDIFKRTGKKIEADDPVVMVALIYSELLKRSADYASSTVAESVNKAMTHTVSLERSRQEKLLPGIKSQLQIYTNTLLAQIKRARNMEHESHGLNIWVVILLCCLCVAIGSNFFSGFAMVQRNEKYEAVGRRLVEVLPDLDKTTREKILNAMRQTE